MLSSDQKNSIQFAYSRFLEARQLRARHGQKLMIATVARCIAGVKTDAEGYRTAGAHVCAVEAGTGTGKTVAYALAAIPLAQQLEKTLVISTATVALQEQIVMKDLPELLKHAELDFTFALAKGRGRYACLYKLDFQLAMGQGGGMQSSLALYPDEHDTLLDANTLQSFQGFLDALSTGKWDGDRDNWPKAIPDQDWRRLSTDHTQCTGRRCAYISQCPFFRARENLQSADVIVANHDLVLADLALGGGTILSAPENTIYIFDEGHHLPDKALQHFATHSRIQGSSRWLQTSSKQITSVAQMLPTISSVQTAIKKWPKIAQTLEQQLQHTVPLIEQIFSAQPFDPRAKKEAREKIYRFANGTVPERLFDLAPTLADSWRAAGDALRNLSTALEELLDNRSVDVAKEVVEQAYTAVGSLWQRCTQGEALWRIYAQKDAEGASPTARWLTLHDSNNTVDIEVCASPVLPVLALRAHIWDRCFAAIITSATLTALGKFERLRLRTGLPEGSDCVIVPSPFNHAQAAQLVVPIFAVEGNNAEAHTASVLDFLANDVHLHEATLVLFSSRKQMRDVHEGVSGEFRAAVLLQDDYSKQQLLQKHRERVDEKQPSVIFGLASFAEGVDLPGDYLRHVVIAKIPFAVPDDPVEQTLSEWIETQGGDAFMQISVADASLRLIQAAGRLLRTETDTGRISILDRRLVTKRYGRALLEGMPPYQQVLN